MEASNYEYEQLRAMMAEFEEWAKKLAKPELGMDGIEREREVSNLPDGWYWVKFGYMPEHPPEVLMKKGDRWWAVGEEYPYSNGFEARNKILAGPLDLSKEARLRQVERALLIAWRVGKFDTAPTAALEELVLAVQLVEGKS